ncbi:hypothetical protein F9C07_2282434 [Aspergillus flavus]|uniref:Uncharacterized protein n=4 Tax=Aspergillus subgen. Circumdati TaxID=2720871 RepID=B8NGE0_ASPFN|nr:uncharacterized protein G4B84_005408 [Aspergillus flavus NRRL3357]EIT78006.1 hypothetical protein Ao3042_05738 [Aspergillus oryzae 3.042]KAB8242198.1 hypothetical protein BDV35DRAFT_33661 [Aspergillus flavus]KDE79438.1 hypothetical protein AO1008_06037 [Aspergillus oryzae 100-8]KOC13110.1 hypothetical protein AFLA70_16g004860 [Aspergillus flavus AF70]OOO14840.1 hypothetical protein OAory_01034350 [Aspergillus oryzae]|eukprot:EIT78006.1 hypothetical protein Ao3042_05738 [Aspergillus oryzae 3.042]
MPAMSRRRTSHSEPMASSSANEAFAYPFTSMQQGNQPQRRGPIEGPNGRRLVRRVTWRSSTYKLMASLWVLGVFYIVWLIRDIFFLPFTSSQPSMIVKGTSQDLLERYVGHQECGISSLALYEPPKTEGQGALSHSYCQTRDSLLSAMSDGGRHGFDEAYISKGCFYRWYSNAEVCQILQKFGALVFVGDESLADIYAGFNILLQGNLATGALRESEMTKEQIEKCRCASQFTSASCLPLRITSSEQVEKQNDNKISPGSNACSSSIPHTFVTATSSPASKSAQERFRQLINRAGSQGKPVPVIQSLSLSTSYSLEIAANSMDEWLALAQSSKRDMPFLWIGPTAPGHQKHFESNIHASSWQYTLDTFEAARTRGMETLGMYNATLQADSWDGMHYGEKEALIQAMMVINWLAML